MSKSITCPSGMVLSVRGMKAKEMAHLQDKATIKSGGAAVIDKILGSCIESVIDPGPYPAMPSVNLDAMLLGDKLYALLMIRATTFGNVLTLNTTCPNPRCETDYELAIKLDEIAIKQLSKEDAEKFKAGELMTCKVPSDGRTVTYRLATGSDEKRAVKVQNDSNPLLAMLALRIVSIEGIETVEDFAAKALTKIQQTGNANRVQKPSSGIRDYLDELPLDDFYSLVSEMEKHDCGVEQKIEGACYKCDHVQEVILQLGPNFWRPAKKV